MERSGGGGGARAHVRHAERSLRLALLRAAGGGTPPFEAAGHTETYKRILRVSYEFPEYVSEGARDLIRKLLVRDPQQRMALDKVKDHPWIVANADPSGAA